MVPRTQATSRLASSKMMLADLPPSSRTAGFMESAQACRIRLAVAGPPVNVTFFTSGCDDERLAGLGGARQDVDHARREARLGH